MEAANLLRSLYFAPSVNRETISCLACPSGTAKMAQTWSYSMMTLHHTNASLWQYYMARIPKCLYTVHILTAFLNSEAQWRRYTRAR